MDSLSTPNMTRHSFFNTLYVALLLINAVAVLNEERFLAKSE